ncbi:calcium-binding protein, partial [Pseudomonas sp. CGJS7]|uniref:calcium-binding protein n=1 Tax=Pseudomonas sp. CGJS7 TaxID=3109348 RepID=UPI00300A4A84
DNGAYSSAAPYADTLRFGAGINQSDVAFQRVGDDLKAVVAGQGDQVVIKDWYKGAGGYKIENVVFGDGSSLNSGQIDGLIAAMATAGDGSRESAFAPMQPQPTWTLG